MTATAFYRHARIAGGFKLSLSVHITRKSPLASAKRLNGQKFLIRTSYR